MGSIESNTGKSKDSDEGSKYKMSVEANESPWIIVYLDSREE